jgi:hypothetical protein
MAEPLPSAAANPRDSEPLYYAAQGVVWKRPISEPSPMGGTLTTIGFPVCRMDPMVGEDGAHLVAQLMNAGDIAMNGPVADRGRSA